MASRLELQTALENALGSRNVYYEPPATVKMNYPAIVYKKNNIRNTKADDTSYKRSIQYQIIVIDRKPDNSVIDTLLGLPYCGYDRHYVSDNLHHDVLTIYF